MRVLLMVDHKWRDLPGHAWIAESAAAAGHRVDLVRNGFHYEAAWRTRPDAVVVPHVLEPQQEAQARALAAAGTDIVILPTEGIPSLTPLRDEAAGRDYAFIARYCVWNDVMRERLVAHRAIAPERIRVIGVPRFDFYRPPLSAILPERAAARRGFGLDPARPTVLWATNFCSASAYARSPEFYRDDWRRLGLARMLGDVDDFCRADILARDRSTEVMAAFIAANPDVQMLVKTHPSDDVEFFRRFVAACPPGRVALAPTSYIWEALPAADVLVKRSCTTGVEAWILGMHTIELQMDPARCYYSPEHAAGSPMATDLAELTAQVREALAGAPIAAGRLAARERFIGRWCFAADGRATERFVAALDDLARERAAAGRAPDRRVASSLPLGRRLRQRALGSCDYFLHDRRLYGWFSRQDHLGRVDKWYRRRDGARWRERLRPLVAASAGAHAVA